MIIALELGKNNAPTFRVQALFVTKPSGNNPACLAPSGNNPILLTSVTVVCVVNPLPLVVSADIA